MQTKPFNKYLEQGAYHYNHTIGANNFREFDPSLSARYHTCINLLEIQQGDLILDAGSGEGVAAIIACKAGARAVAVELEDEARRLGKQIAQEEGLAAGAIEYIGSDIYALEFPDNHFDKIVSLEVIEHMPDIPKYLEELKRVLKPGGTIVFSTPHKLPSGKLQDPYHTIEFDHNSLKDTLDSHFTGVETFSCWSPELNDRYFEKLGQTIFGKIRRNLIKYKAWRGANPFVGPCNASQQSPLIIARAKKAASF